MREEMTWNILQWRETIERKPYSQLLLTYCSLIPVTYFTSFPCCDCGGTIMGGSDGCECVVDGGGGVLHCPLLTWLYLLLLLCYYIDYIVLYYYYYCGRRLIPYCSEVERKCLPCYSVLYSVYVEADPDGRRPEVTWRGEENGEGGRRRRGGCSCVLLVRLWREEKERKVMECLVIDDYHIYSSIIFNVEKYLSVVRGGKWWCVIGSRRK